MRLTYGASVAKGDSWQVVIKCYRRHKGFWQGIIIINY